MKLIEILDSEAIRSNIEGWMDECQKFKVWYCKLGTQQVDELEMEKAYLKIEPKAKKENSLYKILP